MKKTRNKVTNDFLTLASKNKKFYKEFLWYYDSFNAEEETFSFVINLSKADFKKLVSDKYWETYPLFKVKNSNEDDERSYASILEAIFYNLIILSSEHRKEIILHSEGIIRLISLNFTEGSDILQCAKFGLKSSDVRVRKASASIVPVKVLQNHLKNFEEKNKSVITLITKRIGILNISDSIKKMRSEEDSYASLSYAKALYSFKSPKEISEKIESLEEDVTFESAFFKERIISGLKRTLIYKLESKDCPFYISSFSKNTPKYIPINNMFQCKILKQLSLKSEK